MGEVSVTLRISFLRTYMLYVCRAFEIMAALEPLESDLLKSKRCAVSNEIERLSLRSKLASTDICDICSHHEQEYLHKYSVLQRKCCNVFDQHKDCKPRKKSLREITSKCRASALKSGHLSYARRQTLLIVQDTLTEIVCPSS